MGGKTIILNRAPTARVVAVVVALGAFVVAIVAGLAVNNPADVILTRALASMGICFVLGLMVGAVCERVVQDHVAAQNLASPLGPEEAEIVV